MQNLFTKIRCVSWNKLFFSCCLVCISVTRAFWCQYALEKKVGIPACDATGKFAQKPVYRRVMPQGSLHKAGIPASDVLRVNSSSSSFEKCLRAKWGILAIDICSARLSSLTILLY